MAFIHTTPVSEASGEVRAMYQRQQSAFAFVPNYAKVFCHRPDVMQAWAELQKTFRRHMDLRLYELATLAAARAINSSYCSLAHTKTLLQKYYREDEVEAILLNTEKSPLSEKDKAVMRLADKVARDASQVSEYDIVEMQHYGYSDEEIFDVVTAAAARCFFAKIPDALGAKPDAPLAELGASLKNLLLVGRAPSDTAPEVLV